METLYHTPAYLKAIYQPKGRAREYCPWAVNLYRGCGQMCAYCYAPDSLHMTNEEFHKPAPRVDIITKLTKDCANLKANNLSCKTLFCFSCDPYQAINNEFQLMRQAIEILHFYGQSVVILTKGGHHASADIPLLTEGDEFAVTLTCSDNRLSRLWEPNAALPEERIDTLKEVHARGIYTWVSMEPVLYPVQSLDLIEQTHTFVKKYKLGILNYSDKLPDGLKEQVKNINWQDYGVKAVSLVKKLGKEYYIKDDLKAYLPNGVE